MSDATTMSVRVDRFGRIRAIAVPVGVVVLTLLSLCTLCTLWVAALIRGAPLLEPGGVISWQAQVELILAYVNFGWIGLVIITSWCRWSMPTALTFVGFALNYAAWVVMTIEVPS